MKTHKTYQEAKIANPDSDIFYADSIGFASGDAPATPANWKKCNPADYCMTLVEFLAAGLLLVEDDLVLDAAGVRVVKSSKPKTGEWLNLSSASIPMDGDDEIHILRAKALEEKEVEYEYIKVTDSIFDLQADFEAGELYCSRFSEVVSFVELKKEHLLMSQHLADNIYRRTIKKPDWRDEVVKIAGGVILKDDSHGLDTLLITGDCKFTQSAAESLARAILSGIEKAGE